MEGSRACERVQGDEAGYARLQARCCTIDARHSPGVGWGGAYGLTRSIGQLRGCGRGGRCCYVSSAAWTTALPPSNQPRRQSQPSSASAEDNPQPKR